MKLKRIQMKLNSLLALIAVTGTASSILFPVIISKIPEYDERGKITLITAKNVDKDHRLVFQQYTERTVKMHPEYRRETWELSFEAIRADNFKRWGIDKLP